MSKITPRSFKAVPADQRKKDTAKRVPMRSHAEIAKEFGISEGVLTKRLTAHPELNPPPYMVTGRQHYYDPVKMRAWLNRYNHMKQTQLLQGE